MLSLSFSPPDAKAAIVPIWFVLDISATVPAMLLPLVRVPAISVPPTWVTPPDAVLRSTVPAPAETTPFKLSAVLSSTAIAPVAVTAEMVPIWLAPLLSVNAPAIPPELVKIAASRVPPGACVTPPTVVVKSTVLPAIFPANVSA